jgi:hypothetical protein
MEIDELLRTMILVCLIGIGLCAIGILICILGMVF